MIEVHKLMLKDFRAATVLVQPEMERERLPWQNGGQEVGTGSRLKETRYDVAAEWLEAAGLMKANHQ